MQYYALGVPAAGALDVYIAIDAAPERLTYLAANTANRDADRLADRVVEAVLLESLIQWQRKAGLVRCIGFPSADSAPLFGLMADRARSHLVLVVSAPEETLQVMMPGPVCSLALLSNSYACMPQAASGATTAHLHAAMWEFSCGGAAVPARVAEELRTLPPRALSAMVHRTPLSIANGVVRNLAALPAALGQDTEVCRRSLPLCSLCIVSGLALPTVSCHPVPTAGRI